MRNFFIYFITSSEDIFFIKLIYFELYTEFFK